MCSSDARVRWGQGTKQQDGVRTLGDDSLDVSAAVVRLWRKIRCLPCDDVQDEESIDSAPRVELPWQRKQRR